LERAGYEVETAKTAAEAKEKIMQTRYVAALIDIKLPDADGTDLLLKLLKLQEW
jgi:DNA-binding response OmpR family regulator